MGAADIVPGVSGGTVAFITGIYQELIESIKSCNPTALKCLFQQGPRAFWQYINGQFLLILVLGILTSFILFANLIVYLLTHFTILIWSLFFGLVLGSAIVLYKALEYKNVLTFCFIFCGTLIAWGLSGDFHIDFPYTPLFIFLAGAIAICAMILPGVSGSYLLLMMGLYMPILTALKSFDFYIIFIFLTGAITGILSFSRLLSWLLNRFYTLTLSFLIGFLLGSLNLLWPWKHVISYRVASNGLEKPLLQENVLPYQYFHYSGMDAMVTGALLMFAMGFLLVMLFEYSKRFSRIS